MTIIKHTPRVYGNFVDELINSFPENWNKEAQPEWSTVPVNINENAVGYNIELNAPGRSKEDFKIGLDNSQLTISFEKKEETEKSDFVKIRSEFNLGSFKRVFTLDEKVNVDAIEAKYENGILKIYLPKKEAEKVTPKQITIL
jgi:HSP20 family protein